MAAGAHRHTVAFMARRIIDEHDRLLSLMAVVAIAVGACLHVTGLERAGDAILAISVALLLVSLILTSPMRSSSSAGSGST
jgi:hypothetical protein